MFTSDNSTFTAADRAELNKALTALLADVAEDDREQAEKNYSGLLNNAWHDGMTADELIAAVSAEPQMK